MATIELSDKVVNLVKSFEGFSSKPKWDLTGYAIGYGNHYDEDSNPITKDHPTITEVEGDKIMRAAMNRVAQKVAKAVDITKLTQYQFEALVSFKYNCYSCIFEDSQLAILIKNDPLDSKIKQFFLSHCNDAHGNYLSGLANRRAIEYKFYETGVVDKNTKATEYGNISQESDVNSNDSKVQVRYANTNYCNGITCTNHVSTSKPVWTTTGANSGAPPVTFDDRKSQTINGTDAMHVICVLFKSENSDIKLAQPYKFDKWSVNNVDNGIGGIAKIREATSNLAVGKLIVNIIENRYLVTITTEASHTNPMSGEINKLVYEKVKYKGNVITDFESIMNYYPKSGEGFFDGIYFKASKEGKYGKISWPYQYLDIINSSQTRMFFDGVQIENPNKTVFWFKDIPPGHRIYFSNEESCLVTFFSNGKYTIFAIFGDSRGNSGGWDNIHMLNCTNKV